MGARRRRGGAARDRAGVQGRGRDEAAVLHHRVGDPHADPACDGGPGGALGPARHCARRSSGASSSASPTPGATPPASRPGARGSTAAGWSTARRCGRAARTTRRSASPRSAPTPTRPKHKGITTMVIDMHAEGVEVRPLKMTTGQSEFNEVFFNDVFVPDDDVIGPVNGGWTVARATLGNESVSIGGGQGGGGGAGGMQADVADRRARRTSRATGRRGGAHRPLRVDDRSLGGAQHAERAPCRRRRRSGARGQRRQARALGARPRGRRHPRARWGDRSRPTPRVPGR